VDGVGQLEDGTTDLLAIDDRGGPTVVSEATPRSMPLSALQHGSIDYCRKIAEMAILTDLARHNPGEPEREAAALIETENRIAEAIFNVTNWWHQTIEDDAENTGIQAALLVAQSKRGREKLAGDCL